MKPNLQHFVCLIADDEPFCTDIVTTIVSDLGGLALIAENGQQAIDTFREGQYIIDIVVMDIVMPVLDGLAAVEAIQRFRQEVEIIFCSGYASQDKIAYLKNKFQANFISKPLDHDETHTVIMNALNRRHSKAMGL